MAAEEQPKIDALYKLVIVGGGPAGVGVLFRATRIGLLNRLLDPVQFGTPDIDLKRSQELKCVQKGVALLHNEDATTLGNGRLGEYQNNSNIFAKAFLASLLDDKHEVDPPETIKGTCLEDMVHHESIQRMEFIGAAQACLVEFGNVLHQAGACFAKEFAKHKETSSLLLGTVVTKVDVLANGLFRVEAKSYESDTTTNLFAEHVVLATGGHQRMPSLGNPKLDAKLFASDDCLRKEGFVKLKQFLLQSKSHQVCIVGGSHSSFSVAWMLLNRWNADFAKLVDPAPEGDAAAGVAATTASTATSTTTATAAASPVRAATGTPKEQASFFKPKEIMILHRSPIRCYYASKREAEADGVIGWRADRVGSVNCFTGIREDAKRLFRDVQAGKETRVRLIHVNKDGNQAINQKAYETSAVIVWSCGYQTNRVPVFDATTSQEVTLMMQNGVVKCDPHGCLQKCSEEDGKRKVDPIAGLYGNGLGYYLRAEVDEMGEETKVDGVAVYHRQGAMNVLAGIFGPERVFGTGCHSYTEYLDKAEKLSKERAAREAHEAKEAAEKVVKEKGSTEELPPVVIKGSVKSLEKVKSSPRDLDIALPRSATNYNSGSLPKTASTGSAVAMKPATSPSKGSKIAPRRSFPSPSKVEGNSGSIAPLEEAEVNATTPRHSMSTPPAKKAPGSASAISSPRGPGKKQVVLVAETTTSNPPEAEPGAAIE